MWWCHTGVLDTPEQTAQQFGRSAVWVRRANTENPPLTGQFVFRRVQTRANERRNRQQRQWQCLVTQSTQHCPALLSVDHYCTSVWGTSLCQSNPLAKRVLFFCQYSGLCSCRGWHCIHPVTQHRQEESIETTVTDEHLRELQGCFLKNTFIDIWKSLASCNFQWLQLPLNCRFTWNL